MNHLDRQAVGVDITLLVHQTGHVGRHDVLGTGIHAIAHLMASHTYGHLFVVHGEGELTATTDVGLLHLNELQALDMREQLSCLPADMEVAQAAATVMEGHLMREFRMKVDVLELVDQKISQLVDVLLKPFEIKMIGSIEKQLGIAFLDEGDTRGRRRHHGSVVVEVGQELVAERLRLLDETGIKGETATTGLFGIVIHFHASFLQDFHGINRRLRVELVNETWNKKVNYHRYYFYCKIIVQK